MALTCDTITDVSATDKRLTFRERVLQTRNGMLDHVHYPLHALSGACLDGMGGSRGSSD